MADGPVRCQSASVSAADVIQQLAAVIKGHRWDELPTLLHQEFACRYSHTGESFGRDAWVRINADYPGFESFLLEDCVGDGDRAAGRAHVTGVRQGGQLQHFEVATFLMLRDGLIVDMTEVWTDVDQRAPGGTRPQRPGYSVHSSSNVTP